MRRKRLADRWHFFKERAIIPAAAALFIFIFAAVQDLFYYGSGMGVFSLVVYVIFIIGYAISCVKYDGLRRPLLDEYIIGDAFRGLDAASRKFRKAFDLLFKDGIVTLALDAFQQVDEYELKEREKAVLYYYMGITYREMGYPTNAAVYFERSAENMILHPIILLHAERSYAEAGNISKAEELIGRMYVLGYDKKYYDFLEADRGRLYLREDMADKAADIFLKAMEDSGEDKTSCICGLAIAYLLLGDVEKSRDCYRRAVLKENFSAQDGYADYYAQIARSCGLFDKIKDILPPPKPGRRERDD